MRITLFAKKNVRKGENYENNFVFDDFGSAVLLKRL